jgi:hypothetical protein
MISILKNRSDDCVKNKSLVNNATILQVKKIDSSATSKISKYNIATTNERLNQLSSSKNCGKNKKNKAKDVPTEWILEMQELRHKLGVSYLGLAKLYKLTRHVVVNALTNHEDSNVNVNDESTVKLSDSKLMDIREAMFINSCNDRVIKERIIAER